MSFSKDNIDLIKNTSALSLIQLSNYIFPLLLIPYLSRVLGLEKYGVVAFGLGLAQLSVILTDYGFNLSATYKIAKENKNKIVVNKIISSVFLCKIGLVLLAIFLLFIFIFIDDKYKDYHLFFLLMIIPIIGQAFQPVFFFQGLERMVVISIITSIGRTFYLLATLIFVTSPEDYIWVSVTNGFSHLIIAGIEIYILYRMGYSFLWPDKNNIKVTFSESTPFFWGRSAAAIYTAGGTVFLGFFSNPIQVGLYSAAEQLYRGALSLIVPLNQALYPYMIRTRNILVFKKIIIATTVISFIGVGLCILIAPWIIDVIFGKQFVGSTSTLIIFMIVSLFVLPSSLLGFPFLAALGDSKTANGSIIYGGILHLFLLMTCYLFDWISALQVVFCILVVEFVILTIRIIAALKLHKKLS
ncbi:oligosaccharide flippase family protein [Pectobacterium quasiaquaticum]|uniref:oligosaccharide flippase family protein n=1 Tax=Pectobacterium quasiaquaticum TaxID=2774015 RepID=UPI0018753F3B|nr:oligosaccharide flippase family protein [Pectobacterium quasiaquaticum]URG51616.1 oligosaccharide flippase family protein [Pectobacterium quasiaquaticum]